MQRSGIREGCCITGSHSAIFCESLQRRNNVCKSGKTVTEQQRKTSSWTALFILICARSPYSLTTAVLRQSARSGSCPKIHPHSTIPATANEEAGWPLLPWPFPFLLGPCQAAAHVCHRLLEASIHLLAAADTRRNNNKPVNAEQQNRCPEQVAGAETR